MDGLAPPRILDHLVLPVCHIDTARTRYEKLGFTVAPDGLHPFGTENCCIFFRDGMFLEPVGITRRETCEEEARHGNTFVANDLTYRFRRGVDGFSHLVIKSDDAEVDDALYRSEGMSGGQKVEFSRPFKLPNGETGRAAFRLAFARDSRSPDACFFSCEVLDAPQVDRSVLQAHANGVTGLKEIILSEINPTDFQYFLQTWLNQREMDINSFGLSLNAVNGQVTVMTPAGMKAYYNMDVERSERGMLFQAFVLSVQDMSQTENFLEGAGIDFSRHGPRISVAPAEGQGATIMFEEQNP